MRQSSVLLSTIWICYLVCLAQGLQQEEQDSRHQSKIPGAGLTIVFIFGGLAYGGILKALVSVIKLPYNPLLMISGIIIGYFNQSLGFIGESARLIGSANPNDLLAIFLPALVYESAYKLEWHMFKKQLSQIIILGIPCVIVATSLNVLGIKFLLGSDSHSYSTIQAYLLGSILCCTDIFSFVSKLKECGTPKKIISIIEGESLVNYCTCFLFFQIISQLLIKENWSFFSLFYLLFCQIVGGFLYGIISGFLVVVIIKRVSYDGVLIVTVMTITCYSIYVLAQFSEIRVSGIITLVVHGIFMGIFGKAHIVGNAEITVRSFWSYAVFVAQTNIFLIAGVFVGLNVFYFEELVTRFQMINITWIYGIVLLARLLSIALFKSPLSKWGYGMRKEQAIIITFSGLKGAIGISFAMIVFHNSNHSLRMRNLLLLHVTGASLLTLLINSLLTPKLINWLQLSAITKVEYKFFDEYLHSFVQKIKDKKALLISEEYLRNVSWEQIEHRIGMPEIKQLQKQIAKKVQNEEFSKIRFEKQELYDLEQSLHEFVNLKQTADQTARKQFEQANNKLHILVEIRKRFILSLISKYWTYHKIQYTMPEAVVLLLQSAYVDLDTETEELQSWIWIKNQFTMNIGLLSSLRNFVIIGKLARKSLFNYISYCYDVVSSYIEANEQVRAEFMNEKMSLANEQAVLLILKQSQENAKQAELFLTNFLKTSFPEIEKQVKTRKASFNLLLYFEDILKREDKVCQIQVGEYEALMDIIDQRKLELQLHSPTWEIIPFKDSLKEDEAFSLLPDKILNLLQSNSVFENYNCNQIIQTPSCLGRRVYFLRRGGCTLQYPSIQMLFRQRLVVGDIFGAQSIVTSMYQTTVTSNTYIVVCSIKKIYLLKIMDYFPNFQQAFFKKHLFIYLRTFTYNQTVSYYLSFANESAFSRITADLIFKRLPPGEHTLTQDAIFLRGKGQILSNDDQYFRGIDSDGQDLQKIQYFNTYLKESSDKQLIPFCILGGRQQVRIKITQKSSFFIGHIDFKNLLPTNRTNSYLGLSTIRKKISNFESINRREQTRMIQQ